MTIGIVTPGNKPAICRACLRGAEDDCRSLVLKGENEQRCWNFSPRDDIPGVTIDGGSASMVREVEEQIAALRAELHHHRTREHPRYPWGHPRHGEEDEPSDRSVGAAENEPVDADPGADPCPEPPVANPSATSFPLSFDEKLRELRELVREQSYELQSLRAERADLLLRQDELMKENESLHRTVDHRRSTPTTYAVLRSRLLHDLNQMQAALDHCRTERDNYKAAWRIAVTAGLLVDKIVDGPDHDAAKNALLTAPKPRYQHNPRAWMEEQASTFIPEKPKEEK